MNAEQKERAIQLITTWRTRSITTRPDESAVYGDCMTDILQELVDAPETEPVAYATGYYAGCLSIATIDGRVLPAGTALYAAPPHQSEHHLEMVNTPAPSVPDGWIRAIDEAMVVHHIGIADRADSYEVAKKKLNALLAINSDIARDCSEPPAELPTWENGDDPLVGGGLISRGVVDFATVGIWPTKPAPSVPVEPMENIALNEWLDKTEWVQKQLNTFPVSSLGMHRADVMRLEIERLRKLLSAPTPAEPPADLVRDAEPWKLLLENLVEGLNKTYWSSWQGTAHFDEYLREAISAIERDKLKGQS